MGTRAEGPFQGWVTGSVGQHHFPSCQEGAFLEMCVPHPRSCRDAVGPVLRTASKVSVWFRAGGLARNSGTVAVRIQRVCSGCGGAGSTV